MNNFLVCILQPIKEFVLTSKQEGYPMNTPESDGTLQWTATTLVIVKIWCGGIHGLGYTYSYLLRSSVGMG
jgi:hypothetical protein